MRKYLLAAVSATLLATPAFAQSDAPFTGLRVEGIVGYDAFNISEDSDDTDADDTIDGLAYGVQGGYDFNVGNIVVGVEGEFTDSTGELEDDEDVFSVRAGRDLYVGGRVGFLAGPRSLIYLKGGYTNTAIEYDEQDGTETFELDTEIDGFRLGAGAEFLFGRNTYGKVEYRYSNYSSLQDEGGADIDIDLDRHQVVAGVGFRF
jgi:outer membrane immunogenic protein